MRSGFVVSISVCLVACGGLGGPFGNQGADDLLPVPSLDVYDVSWNVECSSGGDFCVRARFDLCNGGAAATSGRATCQLIEDGRAIVSRMGDELWVGRDQCVASAVDFPEATLGSRYAADCW